jgi:hypothetical protein
MDSSFDKEQKPVLYLVQWKGYLQEKDWTEEPYENFINAMKSLRLSIIGIPTPYEMKG